MALRELFTGQPAVPSQRTLAVLAVVIVLLGSLAYMVSPFRAAGGLKCGPALVGAKPRERATFGLLVGREKQVCRSRANSRLLVGGFAFLFALIVGVGAVFLPAGPTEDIFFVRRQ